MNIKLKKKTEYSKKLSQGLKGKLGQTYSSKSKENNLASMKRNFKEKTKGYSNHNKKFKTSKLKVQKPDKHTFECGRKFN